MKSRAGTMDSAGHAFAPYARRRALPTVSRIEPLRMCNTAGITEAASLSVENNERVPCDFILQNVIALPYDSVSDNRR